MNICIRSFASKQIAVCLSVILAMPLSNATMAHAQEPAAAPAPANTQTPATAQQMPSAPEPQNNAPALESRSQSSDSQPEEIAQQDSQKPVGTAAAPVVKPAGVAGSRPAGAAIAPAKQRRVRRIIIRFGIILGAAAAVGTTMALTHGSPSRP